MSEKNDDGGAAFPYREDDGMGGYVDHFGMTLRDYFAAAALTGLLASGNYTFYTLREDPEMKVIYYDDSKKLKIAAIVNAYKVADAMIDERKEGA